MSKIVGSHVFDLNGQFVGHVLEYNENNGANIHIQLANDRNYGKFYAKGQLDGGWYPRPPQFPSDKNFIMSSTFKKYKDYISSEIFKQKMNALKASEDKGGVTAKSFLEITKIKMLWLSRPELADPATRLGTKM